MNARNKENASSALHSYFVIRTRIKKEKRKNETRIDRLVELYGSTECDSVSAVGRRALQLCKLLL